MKTIVVGEWVKEAAAYLADRLPRVEPAKEEGENLSALATRAIIQREHAREMSRHWAGVAYAGAKAYADLKRSAFKIQAWLFVISAVQAIGWWALALLFLR